VSTNTEFEASYKKLEEILEWFDSDDFDLDEAETKFAEGVKLVEALKKKLTVAKIKVEKLEKSLE
jgi:exodeoxyribonuclease VII small subunit